MKHAKKLASLLLALVMVFALTTTAFAEETTYSITINNSTAGHTYEAYQIFTGDLATNEAGNKVLSNIVWGSGVSEEGKTALQNKYDTAEAKSAAGVAEALTTANAEQFAKDVASYLTSTKVTSTYDASSESYTISGLAAGYYLVKDQDGSLTGDADAYTEYIIKVVSDTTATPKSSVPTVEKKVKDTNDSTGVTSGWQDSADYDIGDSVPFQLKATLADNVSAYTTYKVVFHDTLSKGLTYNNDAKVYIGGTKTDGFTVTSTVNADGTTTLTVSCDDVKALGAGNSSVITVEYTATLNDNAVLGSAGNSNKVKLEYSNNPNKSEAGNNETGNTPEDTVIVFTYKTVINKVDGDKNPLTGAEFTLEKKVLKTPANGENGTEAEYEWKTITVVKNEEGTIFTFSGLDDGEYRLTETKTPDGYNSIDVINFTITAEHEIESDNPALTSLNGDVTTGEITFTSNTTDGSLSTDVVNKAGATLPSTGGMGTTIFYVLGSVLLVGAAVLLITKKRMSAEK